MELLFQMLFNILNSMLIYYEFNVIFEICNVGLMSSSKMWYCFHCDLIFNKSKIKDFDVETIHRI